MLYACLLVLHLFIPEGSKSHFSPVLHGPHSSCCPSLGRYVSSTLSECLLHPHVLLYSPLVLLRLLLSPFSSGSYLAGLPTIWPAGIPSLPAVLHDYCQFLSQAPSQKDLKHVPSDPTQSHLTLCCSYY